MTNKIKIGIFGGAGYTGGELIRILLNHPAAEIVFVHSKSNAGKPLSSIHQDLAGDVSMLFTDELSPGADVLFLCVGYGEANAFLNANAIDDNIKLIDLSQDFRLTKSNSFKARVFVYGLPELNRNKIKAAQNIANPGCFATAILLGLLPLAKVGSLKEVYTTGITGSTGAGQGLSATAHFSWRANNIQAYKTLTHQHNAEITQSLNTLQSNTPLGDGGRDAGGISFGPWRGDFTRGIFISSQLKCDLSLDELTVLYEQYYASHPFVNISKNQIFLKQVVNTNKCIIQLEKNGSRLVVHSVIDNLLKGASGQAVQNMNLMFGIDETTGLKFKANYF